MIAKTARRFHALRPPVKSLIYLFWIYAFAGSLLSVFTQIFLYQRFSSLALNVVATVLFFTGIMVGFVMGGYAASQRGLNVKYGFLWSFIVLGLSIAFLLESTGIPAAYLAMALLGAGHGLFWLTIHTFELHETRNDERDFYSSLLTTGDQVFGLLGPACATALIWLSGFLHLGTFTLLFTIVPFVYLLGFLRFADIRDYRPQPVRWEDVRYFFTERRNRAAQWYLMGTSFEHFFGAIIPPLVVLAILGSPLSVGMYTTAFAAFSAVIVLAVAHRRTSDNRIRILGISTFGIAAATALLAQSFTIAGLIVYTGIIGVLGPIRRVSVHVIDLETMEGNGRPATDFYATMLLRDLSLWVWRLVAGFFLLGMLYVGTERALLRGGLYLLAASFVLSFIGARVLLAERRPASPADDHAAPEAGLAEVPSQPAGTRDAFQ